MFSLHFSFMIRETKPNSSCILLVHRKPALIDKKISSCFFLFSSGMFLDLMRFACSHNALPIFFREFLWR